jgi:hypothetical protein
MQTPTTNRKVGSESQHTSVANLIKRQSNDAVADLKNEPHFLQREASKEPSPIHEEVQRDTKLSSDIV